MCRSTSTVVGAFAAVALSAALAGCGQSDTSASPNQSSAQVVKEATQRTETSFAGTDRKLPTEGPAAQTGKNVWIIACSTQAAGCELPSKGFLKAGSHLGWKTKLVDGKFDPSVQSAAIRSAAASGADAVVLYAIECAPNKAAIEAAQQSGTKVYGTSLDCDDEYAGGGKPLFDARLSWGKKDGAYGDYVSNTLGAAAADWAIAKTKGDAEIILLRWNDSAVTRHIGDGQSDRLKECGGCQVHEVSLTSADVLGGGVQAKVSAALQRFPKADVVMAPVDSVVLLGAGSAVQQARATGRKLLLTALEGTPGIISSIKDGVTDYAAGVPSAWGGWAVADGVNRMLADQPQVDPGISYGPMDAGHLPKTDVYDGNQPSSGYQDNYLRIWGVS
ncbi:ABC-type sugar transport system, periplasmic component [Actinomadura madurae]|nr:ABC-type sugar transport system, periplasmic component [Actinomadura madurae]